MSQRRYWDQQKEMVEPRIKLEIPYIKISHNTEDLTLIWNILLPDFSLASNKFSIHIQYQYIKENISARQTWENLEILDCNRRFACEIFNELIPFAVYKVGINLEMLQTLLKVFPLQFRYKLKFGKNTNQILYSPPTKPFRTKAKGAPLSKPLLKQAIALDHNHISIIWKPGIFTCGPLKGYVLTLENTNSSQKQVFKRTTYKWLIIKLLLSLQKDIAAQQRKFCFFSFATSY